MPSTSIIEPGTRFARLTVVGSAEPFVRASGKRERRVLAKCDCGIEKSYLVYNLKKGTTRSCGCYLSDVSRSLLKRLREKECPPQIWTVDGETAWIEINDRRVHVSTDDLPLVIGIRWAINGNGYVENGRGVSYLLMHRLVLGLQIGDVRKGDHRDHDPLNNTRSNLRIATGCENQRNALKKRSSANQWKGYGRKRGKFDAAIRIDGRSKWLGSFETEELAARAYDSAAVRVYGEFACLNFASSEGA